MYSYPFETLRSHAMQAYISEWFSPDFHQSMYLPFAGLLLATVVAMALSRRRVPAYQLLWLAAATWGALRSVRHIPIFALIAVPIISRQWGEWLTARTQWDPLKASTPSPPRTSKLVLNATVVLAMGAFVGARLYTVITQQAKMEAEHFPVAAVSFIESKHLPGPMLNHYNWGGYLIWRLYPNRVSIDGRADVYGDEQMEQFANTYNLRRDWQRPFREWGIRMILIPPDAPLAAGLRATSGWAVVYSGPEAIVLIRDQSRP
jgi:hypothetical protein